MCKFPTHVEFQLNQLTFIMSSFHPTECHFGKELKELGSTWTPDLGQPFGVMYCIKCECIPVSNFLNFHLNFWDAQLCYLFLPPTPTQVRKKRRIVAKVQCRNIKNECPKTTCDEPILLPGRWVSRVLKHLPTHSVCCSTDVDFNFHELCVYFNLSLSRFHWALV